MPKENTLCLILGGGRGTRLWPLTRYRAKPAVPVGGKYRLIDIPLSNCLNSGMHQIAVLTQFNSVSLNRHISRTYHFDLFHQGWVQILAAEQTATVSDWYQGTADAVRKHLGEIRAVDPQQVLVLAGDQLYRMDYREMLDEHRSRDADITVAVRAISRQDASRFGLVKIGADGRVNAFIEKPDDKVNLNEFCISGDPDRPYLASLGIYVFETHVLEELLDFPYVDFGSHMLPATLPSHRVYSYRFDGYWEDIGTIRTFYEANLALAQSEPPFSFHDPEHPIYTHPRFLPGCRIADVHLDRVLLADGCTVENAAIHNSLVGNRSVIERDSLIEDTVIMGADFYEKPQSSSVPPVGIGAGSRIRGALIDKNARIGAGTQIEPFPRGTDFDSDQWAVRDGIVVIPKDAVLQPNTVIAPE